MTTELSSTATNLRPKMISGSIWMLSINIFQRSLGVISTIILARLLPPEYFGLVAMATVLIALMQVLTEFGFDVALIQKQNVTRVHYDTAWTFNVIFGLSSASVLILLAWPAAVFYDEPRVTPILAALALSVLMRGFENIGIVNFRKELEYHKEFLFFSSMKISAFVVTVSVALLTRSYWALVIGTLTSRVAGLVLSYALHPYRPRFSVAARKELFSFSVWMFLNNLLLFVRTRGAELIIGRMLGPRSLGLFTIGFEIASLPTTELVAPINRAIFPGYAKMSADLPRLRAAFLNVLAIIAMVLLPTTIGISAVADLAIPVLLGPNWAGAIPLVQLLALVGLIGSLHSNTGIAYIALGRPQIHVILQSIAAAILFPLAIFLMRSIGVIGVAYAYLIANGTILCINVFVARDLLQVPLSRLGGAVIRPLVGALAMYAAVIGVKDWAAELMPVAALLVASITLGAMVFVTTVLGLWLIAGRPGGAEVFMLEHAKRVPLIRIIAGRMIAHSPAV